MVARCGAGQIRFLVISDAFFYGASGFFPCVVDRHEPNFAVDFAAVESR